MSSTRLKPQPEGSGLTLPSGGRRAQWCAWFRAGRARHRVFRVGVFVAGLVLLLAGAAMWMVSALLSAPAVLAGLWVWSREFHWGHRLFRGCLRRTRALWSRAKAHPLRWSLYTLVGIAAAWAGYWALGRYVPL